MEKATKEKGITLIALIITIIVMLILVGVTVSVALNGGLFSKAKEAARDTDRARIEEEITSVVLGFMNENLLADANVEDLKTELLKIKGIISVDENSFPLKVKDENGNEWTIDINGTIKLKEKDVEKEISADDPEASYWKTDGQGTILYYDLPEGVEVPETLIVPCQIGDEKVTTIADYALSGIRIQRKEDGRVILDESGNVKILDATNESGMPIPTGTTSKIKKVVISKGIEEIGDGGLAYMEECTNIIAPSTMTEIGGYVFLSCTSLKDITVLGNINIDSYTFLGCTSLTDVTISGTIGESAFQNCASLTNVNILDGSTTIGNHAFAGCTSLTEVSLSEGVTIIGDDAFENCTALKNINLPESLLTIGEYAFSGCTALSNINIPKRLVTIGRDAFSDCTSVSKIYIPASVDNMGYEAFDGWTSEQTIEMGKIEEPALVHESYTKVGWEYQWRVGCNANIIWGK